MIHFHYIAQFRQCGSQRAAETVEKPQGDGLLCLLVWPERNEIEMYFPARRRTAPGLMKEDLQMGSCCSPSASRFDVLCAQRWSSAYLG